MKILFFIFFIYVNSFYGQDDDNKIYKLIVDWKLAWESENLEKMKSFYTDDYEYIGAVGKKLNLNERIKKLKESFENFKDIQILVDSIIIFKDTDSLKEIKVSFNQKYTSNKYSDYGLKTLSLFKSEETNNEWKIYKEYFEEIKSNKLIQKSQQNSNYNIITVILIIMITIAIIIIGTGMNKSCPECKKWFAIKYVGNEETDRSEGFGSTIKRDYHYNNKGEQSGYTDEEVQVHKIYYTLVKYFECKYCNYKLNKKTHKSYEG
ncbi:MAG TPA: hypothetical protein PKD83_04540 [Ignavibacteria bacterium]|nr:hypothetical protein [Ignavibacteria bacterium]